MNFIEDYPDKEYIYEIPSNTPAENVQWKKLQSYADKVKIKLAIGNIKLNEECKKYGLQYYWGFPITTYYELQGIIDMGVCELFLGVPLTFDLEKCKSYNLPIRVIINQAYDPYIPRENGIQGFFIRPEDIEIYENYIDSVEFITSDNSKEATLLKIYKEDKSWPGNLNLLISNLQKNIDNRAIPDDFAKNRINCQQKCIRNQNCHLCSNMFLFAKEVRKEAIDRKKNIN